MTNVDCVFCKIVSGQIPVTKRYEDDMVLAFNDVNPQALVHVLVIPKDHVGSLAEIDESLAGKIQKVLPKIAVQVGLGEDYQVILNAGRYQEVHHLHYHLKGGE